MKILSVGHALIDIFIPADESVPRSLGFEPFRYFEVLESRMDEVLARFPEKTLMAGGSAANAVKVAASLGLEAHFVGRIGNDHYGDLFHRELTQAGAHLHLERVSENTGICVTFVHDKGKRTIVTSRGASAGVIPSELPLDLLPQMDILILEGYLLYNRETLYSLLRQAKRAGVQVAFDPGNNQVAFEQREEILAILDSYVDYFFANEDETLVLTGLDLMSALKAFQDTVKFFVIKRGPQGCMFLKDTQAITVPSPKISIVDPTGAGDGFTAGFLWGLSKKFDYEKCIQSGTLVACEVLQVPGTKLPKEALGRLQSVLKNL